MTFFRAAAAILAASLLAVPASASLILSTPDQTSGTGLGAVNTVLTVQTESGNDTTESGCVSWNGMSDVTGSAACPPGITGGDEQEQTQTRSIGELSLDSAFNLRVVFNYNEANIGNVTLEDQVLTIYSPDGTLLFESGPFDPRTFDEPFSGTGTAGFVFRLDAEQAAEANQYFDDPDNRIGLAATVTGVEGGPETFFVANATALAAPSADVAVTKSDSPDPVVINETLTYTLTARNNGPNTATDVTVVDTLPSSVTFQTVNTTAGSCTTTGRIVTCDLGSLSSGAEETITITVTPTTAGVIFNSATIAANEGDPAPGNNTAGESTEVVGVAPPQVDLSITKTDSPDPVDVGANLTYTLTVANTGPDDATNVTLTDTLPSSVNFQSATPSPGSCAQSGGVVTCDLGTISSGGNATVNIVVTPTVAGEITNNASVSANESDTDTSNNNASEMTTVAALQADLSITKTDAPDPVATNSTLTYTLTITNNGPDAAADVVVTDTLPASVTYLSATPSTGSCTQSGRTVTCSLGTLSNTQIETVTIEVTSPSTDATISNAANVTSDTEDPVGSNNNATENTTVGIAAPEQIDLSVVKNDSPDPVRVGNMLMYTVEVTNAGPDTATGVTVIDSLPASVTFASASPSQGSCTQSGQTITCEMGSIASGATATVTINVTPQAAGTISNNASATANENDTNLANNSASEATTVMTAQVDLVLDKTDNPDPVVEGETLTYTIAVNNTGPDTATNVIVTDTLPLTVTYNIATSTQGSCAQAGRTVTCDLGALASGDAAMVTITVTPNTIGTDRTITNSAVVTSDQTDTNPANNSETEQTAVNDVAPPRADLALTKTDSPDPVAVGNPLTYTLNVTNNGPETATGTTVTDSLPGSVVFVSATPTQGTCTQSSGVVTCDLGSINSGVTATITITVTPMTDGVITNNAVVSSDLADSDNTNNSATESTQVGAGAVGADVLLTKTDSVDPVNVGQTFSYLLTVENNGPNQATNVQVSDSLPASLAFQSATSTQGSCSETGGFVTCDLGTLNVGSIATVTISVRGTEAGTVTNVATVSADQSEPAPGNNQGTETTTISADATVAVIPTVDEWAMILLTMLLAGVGVFVIRQT